MIVVVIPCFRVKEAILDVIKGIGEIADKIIVVDDCCPESTGDHVKQSCSDPRVEVLRNTSNLGVGGAMKAGYVHALDLGATIVVKIDGDGQMDPSIMDFFVKPILDGSCDYTKGNRFFDLEHLGDMPSSRLIGNAGLSFFNKLSSGYWTLMDPTNGYTAIHANVLKKIPLKSISNDFFFESDMLFRLGTLKAAVLDIPIRCFYDTGIESNLRVSKVFLPFVAKNCVNFLKRLFYNYFLRDFNFGSLALLIMVVCFPFGFIFGASHWYSAVVGERFASSGTVMVAALPLIVGFISFGIFMAHEFVAVPRSAIYPLIGATTPKRPV